MALPAKENWGSGDLYDNYVGRWSRRVGKEFLAWLEPAERLRWADVGCGTGALIDGILSKFDPESIKAVDRAAGFIDAAKSRIIESRVKF